MRIGIDVTSWGNGRGFGRFVRELVGALAHLKSGDEFVLLADRQTAESANFPIGWEVAVGDTAVSPSMAAAADGRRSLRDMLVMRRLAARARLDLVFFPAVYTYFPVGGRVPVIVTFHDAIAETLPHLVFKSKRSRFFWNVKSTLAVRRSVAIVTVSEASKRDLMRAFGLRDSRIRLISEAPSDEFTRPPIPLNGARKSVLSRYGIGPTDRFFLSVGGISPHKNLDTMIDAFARSCAQKECADARLVIVGDYQRDVFRTCYEDLRSLIQRLGIERHVHFAGFVPDDDLALLYAACEAFVFPSFLEGFGLPAVEAMACGAAVLASSRGSLPEVLGGAGFLFDARDPAALAQGMQRVLTDAHWRQDLRTQSRHRAQDFSWHRSAQQALDVFHEFARK